MCPWNNGIICRKSSAFSQHLTQRTENSHEESWTAGSLGSSAPPLNVCAASSFAPASDSHRSTRQTSGSSGADYGRRQSSSARPRVCPLFSILSPYLVRDDDEQGRHPCPFYPSFTDSARGADTRQPAGGVGCRVPCEPGLGPGFPPWGGVAHACCAVIPPPRAPRSVRYLPLPVSCAVAV